MIVFILLSENNMLNSGHGILQKVMEKVMESHGILIGQKYTSPAWHNFVSVWSWKYIFKREKSGNFK